MKFTTGRIIALLIILFIIIQFFPVTRTNPPVETEAATPASVKAILKRSCYDCHSNSTVWPWYSQVAPVSWMVTRDVNDGRQYLNFSTWNRYDSDRLADIYDDTHVEIDQDDMPPWYYKPMHPQVGLNDNNKQTLLDWAVRAKATLNAKSPFSDDAIDSDSSGETKPDPGLDGDN